MVLTAVIVTDNARSALNIEQNQLLYEPPGEAVTISSEIAIGSLSPCPESNITVTNPSSGMIMNCVSTPVSMANLLCTCSRR